MAIIPANSGIFAVLAQNNRQALGQEVIKHFGENYCPMADGQWLIAAPGKTTTEISNLLGVTGESSIGSAVILSVTTYYGRANPQIWEWLAARQRG